MSRPTYKKVNRNSLGQFKRRRETMFFKACDAAMIDNPMIAVFALKNEPFIGPRIIPWKTEKGDGRSYRRNPPANDKRYRSL